MAGLAPLVHQAAGDHAGVAIREQGHGAGLAVKVRRQRLRVDGAEVVDLEEGLHDHLPVAGQREAAAVDDAERLALVLRGDLPRHRAEEVEERPGLGVLVDEDKAEPRLAPHRNEPPLGPVEPVEGELVGLGIEQAGPSMSSAQVAVCLQDRQVSPNRRRRSLNLLGESLRQVHLVDIACSDVMERPLDGNDVLALVHIRLRRPESSGASRRSRSRDTSLNFSQTLFQRSLGTPSSQRPLAGFVIENQQKVINSEAAIRQMQIVNGLEVLISLEESKQVVAEIADRSSGEPDCVCRLRSPGLRQPVERRNRIFMSSQPFTSSAYIDPGALGAEDNLRVPAKD